VGQIQLSELLRTVWQPAGTLDRRPLELNGMLKTNAALRGWTILDAGTPVASLGCHSTDLLIERHPELLRKNRRDAGVTLKPLSVEDDVQQS